MDVLDDTLAAKSGLQISDSVKHSLYKQAYWARFVGIVGLIFCIIFLLFIVFGGSFMLSAMMGGMGDAAMAGGGSGIMTFFLIFYAIFILFGAYLSWLVFDHGRKVLSALKNNHQGDLEIGMHNMARVFKIYGILTAIVIGIYVLGLIMMLIFGGAMLMGG